MRIAFFGSSIVSSYWNGAATYYRGIIKALHSRGHDITFYEPDAYQRQQHRDIEDPPYARVHVYAATEQATLDAISQSRNADLIIKASGVGVFDELLEREVAEARNSSTIVLFWDVDAPATLERIAENPNDAFIPLIPKYDAVFTYGGASPVRQAYLGLGARACVPVYNAFDPSTHFPVPTEERFRCDLAFLGNRLPDREARVEEFFLKPASQLPSQRFLLGGSGWGSKALSSNTTYLDHVYTRDHNAFNVSSRAVLNISRNSMARFGFSPATRVFEAAGAGACVITDEWEGIDMFFEPDKEIAVARDGDHVVEWLQRLSEKHAQQLGAAARKRALAEHTYAHRAELIDATLDVHRGKAA